MAQTIPARKIAVAELRRKLDHIHFHDQSTDSIRLTVSSTGCVRPSKPNVDIGVRPSKPNVDIGVRPSKSNVETCVISSKSNVQKGVRKCQSGETLCSVVRDGNSSVYSESESRNGTVYKHGRVGLGFGKSGTKYNQRNFVHSSQSDSNVDHRRLKCKSLSEVATSKTNHQTNTRNVKSNCKQKDKSKVKCFECGASCVCGQTAVSNVNLIDSWSDKQVEDTEPHSYQTKTHRNEPHRNETKTFTETQSNETKAHRNDTNRHRNKPHRNETKTHRNGAKTHTNEKHRNETYRNNRDTAKSRSNGHLSKTRGHLLTNTQLRTSEVANGGGDAVLDSETSKLIIPNTCPKVDPKTKCSKNRSSQIVRSNQSLGESGILAQIIEGYESNSCDKNTRDRNINSSLQSDTKHSSPESGVIGTDTIESRDSIRNVSFQNSRKHSGSLLAPLETDSDTDKSFADDSGVDKATPERLREFANTRQSGNFYLDCDHRAFVSGKFSKGYSFVSDQLHASSGFVSDNFNAGFVSDRSNMSQVNHNDSSGYLSVQCGDDQKKAGGRFDNPQSLKYADDRSVSSISRSKTPSRKYSNQNNSSTNQSVEYNGDEFDNDDTIVNDVDALADMVVNDDALVDVDQFSDISSVGSLSQDGSYRELIQKEFKEIKSRETTSKSTSGHSNSFCNEPLVKGTQSSGVDVNSDVNPRSAMNNENFEVKGDSESTVAESGSENTMVKDGAGNTKVIDAAVKYKVMRESDMALSRKTSPLRYRQPRDKHRMSGVVLEQSDGYIMPKPIIVKEMTTKKLAGMSVATGKETIDTEPVSRNTSVQKWLDSCNNSNLSESETLSIQNNMVKPQTQFSPLKDFGIEEHASSINTSLLPNQVRPPMQFSPLKDFGIEYGVCNRNNPNSLPGQLTRIKQSNCSLLKDLQLEDPFPSDVSNKSIMISPLKDLVIKEGEKSNVSKVMPIKFSPLKDLRIEQDVYDSDTDSVTEDISYDEGETDVVVIKYQELNDTGEVITLVSNSTPVMSRDSTSRLSTDVTNVSESAANLSNRRIPSSSARLASSQVNEDSYSSHTPLPIKSKGSNTNSLESNKQSTKCFLLTNTTAVDSSTISMSATIDRSNLGVGIIVDQSVFNNGDKSSSLNNDITDLTDDITDLTDDITGLPNDIRGLTNHIQCFSNDVPFTGSPKGSNKHVRFCIKHV